MDEAMYGHVQVGTIIMYHMRLADLPVNPLRLWQGVVEHVTPEVCWVRSIEPGYEGLQEMVFFTQIVYAGCSPARREIRLDF